MPIGWAIMALVQAARRSLAERPSRISWVRRLAAVSASFNVSASVMPAPSRFDALKPRSSARALIWAEAPCTNTTRILSERKTATSNRMFAKFSSVTIAPSTPRMKVFSRNCGMYCRMPRRSVSFTLEHVFALPWAHRDTATDTDGGWLVAQTGSLLFRRMVFGRWADCQSATQQTASLRYGGSAKMRPRRKDHVLECWRIQYSVTPILRFGIRHF